MEKAFSEGIVFVNEKDLENLVNKAMKNAFDAIRNLKENDGIHVEGEDE